MGSKKLRNKHKPKRALPHRDSITYLNYTITHEAMPGEAFELLPEAVKERNTVLHGLAQKQPDLAIPELEKLIEQYPDVPQFSNYLYTGYRQKGDQEKSHTILLESLEKFPDYLFAKLAYGEYLLTNEDTEGFAKLFDNKFDLKLLYPHRDVFHITEFVLFTALAGWYFCLTDKLEAARLLLQGLSSVESDHPATRLLEHQILMAAFRKMTRNQNLLTE